jgi:hypothetical protein
MRSIAPFARIGIVACVASCATTTVGSDSRAIDALSIAPYDAHDECFDLALGDRLDYRYQSSVPIDFDVHYRAANAVVSPIVRSHSTADSDIFEVRVPARYCAEWQVGADAATVGYRLLVRRAGR